LITSHVADHVDDRDAVHAHDQVNDYDNEVFATRAARAGDCHLPSMPDPEKDPKPRTPERKDPKPAEPVRKDPPPGEPERRDPGRNQPAGDPSPPPDGNPPPVAGA